MYLGRRESICLAAIFLTFLVATTVFANNGNGLTWEHLFPNTTPEELEHQRNEATKALIEDLVAMRGEPAKDLSQHALELYLTITDPAILVDDRPMAFIWYWLNPSSPRDPFWYRKASRCVGIREFLRTADMYYVLDNLPPFSHPADPVAPPNQTGEIIWEAWLTVAQTLSVDGDGTIALIPKTRLLFMDLTFQGLSLFCSDLLPSGNQRTMRPLPKL